MRHFEVPQSFLGPQAPPAALCSRRLGSLIGAGSHRGPSPQRCEPRDGQRGQGELLLRVTPLSWDGRCPGAGRARGAQGAAGCPQLLLWADPACPPGGLESAAALGGPERDGAALSAQAGDTSIGWALGYMLNLTNMIPAETPSSHKSMLYNYWVVLILLFVVTTLTSLVTAVCLLRRSKSLAI